MKIADGFVLAEVCPHCGKIQPHAKSVCNYCGKIMVVAKDSEIPYCKSCECKELRATKHALWMAMAEKYKERAKRFKDMAQMYFNWSCEDGYEYKQEAKCDRIVLQAEKLERKCLQKAKEFE